MIDKTEENYEIPSWLKWVLWIVGFLLLSFFIIIIYQYTTSLTDGFIPDYPDREEWGVFGDFFGGVLNPVFGFASFIALLATIFYQAKELNASTKELKNSATALAAQNKAIELQSFEQTFFSWMDTYRSLLNDISGMVGPMLNTTYNGREYLYLTFDKLVSRGNVINGFLKRDPTYGGYTNEFQEHNKYDFSLDININSLGEPGIIEKLSLHIPKEVIQREMQLWNSLYRNDIYKLDSLFRTAYKLLVWIDSKDSSKLTNEDKWLYVSIFRSQLSNVELLFLFFNGLTQVGEKFKPIIEKYAIFDNFDPNSDIRTKVIHSNSGYLNYYADEAFSSDLAKAKMQ